jgi:hypothetical protein
MASSSYRAGGPSPGRCNGRCYEKPRRRPREASPCQSCWQTAEPSATSRRAREGRCNRSEIAEVGKGIVLVRPARGGREGAGQPIEVGDRRDRHRGRSSRGFAASAPFPAAPRTTPAATGLTTAVPGEALPVLRLMFATSMVAAFAV